MIIYYYMIKNMVVTVGVRIGVGGKVPSTDLKEKYTIFFISPQIFLYVPMTFIKTFEGL